MADIVAWFSNGPHDNEAHLIPETDRYQFPDGEIYVKVGMTETQGEQKHQFSWIGDQHDPGIADAPTRRGAKSKPTFGDR